MTRLTPNLKSLLIFRFLIFKVSSALWAGHVCWNDACQAYLTEKPIHAAHRWPTYVIFTNDHSTPSKHMTWAFTLRALKCNSKFNPLLISPSWHRWASSVLKCKQRFHVSKPPVAKSAVYIFNLSRWFLHNTCFATNQSSWKRAHGWVGVFTIEYCNDLDTGMR